MKVVEIVSMLLKEYKPDDELAITWFDKDHTASFITGDMTPEQLTEAWSKIISSVQGDLDWVLEHREFIYDVVEELTEQLKKLGAEIKNE